MACGAREKGCGGCPLLDMPYGEQLKRKQALVKKHLSTFGKPRPILGMADPFRYRNKAIATFAMDRGRLVCGIYREGSHHVVPVDQCMLHAPGLDEVLAAVRETARECGLAAYDEDRRTGFLRHTLVRRGHVSGQLLVVLVTACAPFPGKEAFLSRMLLKCPGITTVVQNINPRKTSAVLGFTQRVLYGPGQIGDTLCGLSFSISPRSFYQVNSVQTEVLYREAIRLADLGGQETAIDAYCGIGTLTLAAAGSVQKMVGIELNPDAVKDAIQNAKANGIGNAFFLKGDAGQGMAAMAEAGESVGAVFFDPPRSGCSGEFLSALCALKPEKAVYISCNVETQSRDLRFLKEHGYSVRAIQPVDMFPHTEHVECVVSMSRAKE